MNVITVTQLNTYIKSIIDSDVLLRSIYVVGEISNFKHYYKSGHMYLTLKDENTQIKAVMFSSYSSRLKFKPDDGMRVVCRGRISVYDRDGAYQLYIEDMQPDGIGALSLAYEQLKQKLAREGFFDIAHKKPIPKYPEKIGIATSNMGAAVEDIKNITKRRFPVAELVIVPTIVQGEQAPADIVESIKLLDSIEDIDVIIVGRGGGSIEDLWAFNTEMVAQAVYDCQTPVISAVGHETDFTICDFVADLRAETPSAAAENAVPDINALLKFIDNSKSRMIYCLRNALEQEQQRLDRIRIESILGNYQDYFRNNFDIVDNLSDALCSSFSALLTSNKHCVGNLAAQLDALSPLAVIARGYSAVTKNNTLVKSASMLNKGDSIRLDFNDGCALCNVNEVNINGNNL